MKEANIPCPESSIAIIIKIIKINFLFLSKNSFIYFLNIYYLYKYMLYKHLIYFYLSHLYVEYQKYSNLPIINGLSNLSHPCQILADIMAYNEKRGSIKNKKVVNKFFIL